MKLAEENESVRIAHLTMVQGVITRMASNSFTLKALAVSFAGAWTAFLAATDSKSVFYLVAAVIPVIMLWILDGQYLRLERSYRKLYEEIRSGGGVEAFSMDFRPFSKGVSSILAVSFSWSLLAYYLPLLLAVFVLGGLLMWGNFDA